jgi:hypothetical protein
MSTNRTSSARFAFPDWRPRDLHVLLSPETWLGHNTPMEFLDVSGRYVAQVASQAEIKACFSERGITNPADQQWLIPLLLDADVACMSHALTALLSMSDEDAGRLMPARIREITDSSGVIFDHIGVEVFGKLEWYIELFDRAYAPMGINVVREHIFPSVQVRKALEYDTDLVDVRIARIYFSHGDTNVNLEVFEATQSWNFIALRQASLYAHLIKPATRAQAFSAFTRTVNGALEPVGHVAFRVPDAGIVESIQAALLEESQHESFPAMRPYVDQVFFNPADRSTNTKFVVSTRIPTGEEIDSQIVEILSYES